MVFDQVFHVIMQLQKLISGLKKIYRGILTEACPQLNAIYFPAGVIFCVKISIVSQCHIWFDLTENSLNRIQAGNLHSNSSLYRALSNSRKNRHRSTAKSTKPQCKPFGRNTDEGRIEKSRDDICFTPKWVCSHVVDSVRTPRGDRLGAAHPVCCQSYWPSWHDGPSEVLPTHWSSGQRDTC